MKGKAMQFIILDKGKIVEQGVIHSDDLIDKTMEVLGREQSLFLSPLKFTPDKPRTAR